MSQGLTPEQAAAFNAVGSALLGYIPQHFTSAFCKVSRAPHGKLRYAIGSDDVPDDGTNRPSPELHDAVSTLMRAFQTAGATLSGAEVRLIQEGDAWKSNVSLSYPGTNEPAPSEDEEQAAWQRVYDARVSFYEEHFGTLPEYIGKLMNLTGVWPGGGLFSFAARNGRGIVTTFGLSNPDLPPTVSIANPTRTQNADGSVSFGATLAPRTPRYVAPELAGFGYELLVVTESPAESWPNGPVAFFAQAELLRDVDLLDRVEAMGGVTVEALDIGGGEQADFLVSPARAPFPLETMLPNGLMRLLVATRITRNEMNWGMENGRSALAKRLDEAGVGQLSLLRRGSVI